MSARSVVITEGLIGELLRSGPYPRMSDLHAGFARGSTTSIRWLYSRHTQTPCRSTQHTRNQRSPSPSSLIPDQRRWSNRINIRGERTPPLLRARPTAPAYYRERQRAMRASVRSGRSTDIGPSRAVRRGRRAAAGRYAACSGPARSRRRPAARP